MASMYRCNGSSRVFTASHCQLLPYFYQSSFTISNPLSSSDLFICSLLILRGLYAAGFTASMLTSVTIDKPPPKSVADPVRIQILVELGANELVFILREDECRAVELHLVLMHHRGSDLLVVDWLHVV